MAIWLQRNRQESLLIGSFAILCFTLTVGFNSAIFCFAPQAEQPRLYDGTQKLVTSVQSSPRSSCERIENRAQQQAMVSLRMAMSVPQCMPVPPDIPLYRKSGKQLVFSKHAYEEMYFQGWNKCLHILGSTNVGIDGDIMPSCLTSFNNNWESGAGLVAGFHDCQRRVVFLSHIYNLDFIRSIARELHQDIPGGVVWEQAKADELKGDCAKKLGKGGQ